MSAVGACPLRGRVSADRPPHLPAGRDYRIEYNISTCLSLGSQPFPPLGLPPYCSPSRARVHWTGTCLLPAHRPRPCPLAAPQALGGPHAHASSPTRPGPSGETLFSSLPSGLGLTIKPLKKEQFTTGLHREVFSCQEWRNRPRWHHLCLENSQETLLRKGCLAILWKAS